MNFELVFNVPSVRELQGLVFADIRFSEAIVRWFCRMDGVGLAD